MAQPISPMIWNKAAIEDNRLLPARYSIGIFTGIINEEFYRPGETMFNYGRIGAVIAHEIGHAFDLRGAGYDYRGTVTSILTEEDAQKLQQKQELPRGRIESWAQHPRGQRASCPLRVAAGTLQRAKRPFPQQPPLRQPPFSSTDARALDAFLSSHPVLPSLLLLLQPLHLPFNHATNFLASSMRFSAEPPFSIT